MIVHLVGSIRDPSLDMPHLKHIVDLIHDQGGVLGENWLDAALVRHEQHLDFQDWTPFVQNNLESLRRSDIVIVDATHYAFSHGFQTAAAIDHSKPTLVISRQKLSDKLISGIASRFVTLRQYQDKNELDQIISKFIQVNTIHTKDLRFNIFLTREIEQYLDAASRGMNKNKSEIIRRLIKRKIDSEKRA